MQTHLVRKRLNEAGILLAVCGSVIAFMTIAACFYWIPWQTNCLQNGMLNLSCYYSDWNHVTFNLMLVAAGLILMGFTVSICSKLIRR